MLCILHNFARTAEKLKHDAIHLPLPVLRTLCVEERKAFKVLGASCHSIEDAKEAERLGCTYITAGHIFETDCKKGLKGRGLDFLGEVCESVSIPVYAIGGIDAQNFEEIKKTGAYGACIMSGLMKSENPGQYLAGFNLKRK